MKIDPDTFEDEEFIAYLIKNLPVDYIGNMFKAYTCEVSNSRDLGRLEDDLAEYNFMELLKTIDK